MNIVQLTSESMEDLRKKRQKIMAGMIENQEGTLLLLSGAYAGKNRQDHRVSYAVFSIFYELWERFTLDSWSYTFDEEGLMFYIRIDEDAEKVKNILVHFEDHHPLGFAINSEVFSKEKSWTREALGLKSREDVFTKKNLRKLMDEIYEDKKYHDQFVKRVESEINQGDKSTILSNILVYGFVGAFTKPLGFGMYGPNYRGSNDQMNFEKFIHLLRAYKNEMVKISSVNSHRIDDIISFQKNVEEKIAHAVLNQQSFKYNIVMTSLILFSFMNSRGYADISKQAKQLAQELQEKGVFEGEDEQYAIALNGFKELFTHTVPFYQKHHSVESSLLNLMSRHKDHAILLHNGEQSLLKVQFLAKNLMLKEEKWNEMNKFCVSSYIYPNDSTNLMILVFILDFVQRNYLKIKMMFETKN